ncbi:39S ribosomal protein L28, mitochondrial-like [Oppia nitens]|uniref:39S ribosomal protein L28, mitochondrial-like n=1 Tax=Oppia nitens TaxID=1686743 RepID=UPI0023DC19DD|nr:39S ribosomal protein L28, mitochondrial-like [Oppia nitens]
MRFSRIPSWSFPNYKSRLPDHYYQHRRQLDRPSSRVHDRPFDYQKPDYYDLFYNSERHRVERVADVPIPVIYPPEADTGIWGGEGVVKGYVKPRKYFQQGDPRPKMWFPNLKRCVLYSEILDKHFRLICTRRTLDLVDSHYGFDAYLLKTPVQDLKSQLALSLRRLMLLKLLKNDFTDENHGKEMREKYSDCWKGFTLEEAEWFGLSVKQAIEKQKLIDAKQYKPIPLKAILTQELIEELQKMKDSGEMDILMKEEKKHHWLDKFKLKIPFLKTNQ